MSSKNLPNYVENRRFVIINENFEENIIISLNESVFVEKIHLRHFIYHEISSKISSIERGGIHLVVFCRVIKNDDMGVEIDWRTMKCMQRNC